MLSRIYLPDLLCLRKAGSVGGFETEDMEGAAMADRYGTRLETESREHAAADEMGRMVFLSDVTLKGDSDECKRGRVVLDKKKEEDET